MKLIPKIGLFAISAAFALTVQAQELTGTLKKIKDSGTVTIGNRESSIPFSYLDDKQQPVGYSMDLCNKVVDAIKAELKMPKLDIKYQLVTSANRIPLMANGTVDLECGSTTNNLARQEQVWFTITHFVTANRWVFKKSANLNKLSDLKGKTIVSTAGTTNIKQMTELNAAQNLGMNIISANGHPEAFQMVETGRAVAFAMDDILLASLALNGTYALFLDDLFRGTSEIAAPYRREETFGLSQKLWQHWRERAKSLGPGDEYRLVDEFADMVGLRDWYEWRPDPGHHEATAEPLKEGTTNPALLQQKQPAAVFYFLDAFKRFDGMTPEQVRDVAYEIALLGRSGLDYAAPDEKYELRTLPDRKFSGLHLMCLMFAGFKRVAPEHEVQMDLNDPFLTALQMHKNGEGKP